MKGDLHDGDGKERQRKQHKGRKGNPFTDSHNGNPRHKNSPESRQRLPKSPIEMSMTAPENSEQGDPSEAHGNSPLKVLTGESRNHHHEKPDKEKQMSSHAGDAIKTYQEKRKKSYP
jgi:hypothetical protein